MTMSDYEKKRAGKYLRAFIEEHFTSYSDFARFVGVRPCTVTHWMTGRTPVPKAIVERLMINFPEDLPKNYLRPDIYVPFRRG